MSQQKSWIVSCDACGNWGPKDNGTVKIDASTLHARGKENATHPNLLTSAVDKARKQMEEEDQEKARLQALRQKEFEAKQAELRRQEEAQKAMELRVKEEQERQQEEQQRREAERRRLLLEEQQRHEEQLALHEQQKQERKLEAEAQEKARKLQEEEEQKKIHAWLQANGFKEINDLVRKKFSKVAPLQVAIQQKNLEMVTLLLQHGANASKVNGKNESALTVAQKMDKKNSRLPCRNTPGSPGSHAAIIQAVQAFTKYQN